VFSGCSNLQTTIQAKSVLETQQHPLLQDKTQPSSNCPKQNKLEQKRRTKQLVWIIPTIHILYWKKIIHYPFTFNPKKEVQYSYNKQIDYIYIDHGSTSIKSSTLVLLLLPSLSTLDTTLLQLWPWALGTWTVNCSSVFVSSKFGSDILIDLLTGSTEIHPRLDIATSQAGLPKQKEIVHWLGSNEKISVSGRIFSGKIISLNISAQMNELWKLLPDLAFTLNRNACSIKE
jgi:hypothetical protein